MTIDRASDSMRAVNGSPNGRYHGRHATETATRIDYEAGAEAGPCVGRLEPRNEPVGPDVPTGIGTAAHQAHVSFGIGAYLGAVLLARAAIEACAIDQHSTQATLPAQIRELGARQVISPLTQRAAAGLSGLTLDSAHLCELGLVDAQEALSVMDLILEDVYLRPAQLRRIEGLRHDLPTGVPALAVARLPVNLGGRHRQPED
jgi:hypothetical protein